MTETAMFQIICELATANVELKQTQDYLVQTVENLHKRTLALESMVHVLAKAHLERIAEAEVDGLGS